MNWREEDKPTAFTGSVLGEQIEAITAMVKGFLEEAIKKNIRVPQLENVVGPPYFQIRNKSQTSNKRLVLDHGGPVKNKRLGAFLRKCGPQTNIRKIDKED